MGLASVNLVDLQVSGTTVGENWQKAVNTLVTSLKKNRVCLVNLPAEAASNIIATSTACDKFFDEDTSLKREYSYVGTRELGYRQEHAREVYELPVPLHPGLRTPACLSPWTEQAYAVLDRTARVLLQSLSMSHELELSPYALFPLLDFAPCPGAKMSASSLEISRHFKSGAGLSAVEEDEAGALLQREDPGVLTLVSAWEQGLQVQTAKGVWMDVPLSPNQVAVMVGYTLWHATAGLLEPSTHRMLFRTRRDSMAITYRLAARPTAVVDTPHIMAESGHPIPDRFRQQLSVKDLLANFHLGRTPHTNFIYSRASAAGLTTRTPSPIVSRPGPRPSSDTSLAGDQLEPLDSGTPPAVPTPAKPTLRDRTRTATALAALADDPPEPAVPVPTPPRAPLPAPSASSLSFSSQGDPASTSSPSSLSSPSHPPPAPAPAPAIPPVDTTPRPITTPAPPTSVYLPTPTTTTPAAHHRATPAPSPAAASTHHRAAPAPSTTAPAAPPPAAPPAPPLSVISSLRRSLLSRNASPAPTSSPTARPASAPRRATPSPFRTRTRSSTEAESPLAATRAAARPSPTPPASSSFTRPRTAPATRDPPSVMGAASRARPRLTDSETRVRSEDLHPAPSSSAAATRRPPSYLQPTMSTAIRRASKGAAAAGAAPTPPHQPSAKAAGSSSGLAGELVPRKSSWSSSTRSPTAAALGR